MGCAHRKSKCYEVLCFKIFRLFSGTYFSDRYKLNEVRGKKLGSKYFFLLPEQKNNKSSFFFVRVTYLELDLQLPEHGFKIVFNKFSLSAKLLTVRCSLIVQSYSKLINMKSLMEKIKIYSLLPQSDI